MVTFSLELKGRKAEATFYNGLIFILHSPPAVRVHTHLKHGLIYLFFFCIPCMYEPHLQQHKNFSRRHYGVFLFLLLSVRSYSLVPRVIQAKKAEPPTVISLYGFSHNVFAASLLIMGLGGPFSPC